MARYYMAYGSNLNKAQMRFRCPQARPYRALLLSDFRLDFRTVADITYKQGANIAIALYQVTAADERQLDRFEGFPWKYGKREFPFEITNADGSTERVDGFFYYMNGGAIAPPRREYAERIGRGYQDWGLPVDLLQRAIKRSQRAIYKSARKELQWQGLI
jgi:hypothetical protein